jgi:hypothetical protein
MLATLMRGALADALDDAPAAPDGDAPGLAGDDAPLLLAIVPVTCTRLSTRGENSDAVPSSAYVLPAAAAPDVPAAPGVPAPDVPAAPGDAAPDPLPVVASVRMNDATPEDDCAEALGAPGALGALPLDAPPRSRHPVNVIVLA